MTGPAVWTVDVPVLDRAVEVTVNEDRPPLPSEVVSAVDTDQERMLVERMFEQRAPLVAVPTVSTVHEHVAVCGAGCCPGCGTGCDQDEFEVCVTGEIGCVMPDQHPGRCVVGTGQAVWHIHKVIQFRAERLRIAGIPYGINQSQRNASLWRLDYELDRQVPDSGRYRRRLTATNRPEMIEWIGSAARPAAGPVSDIVIVEDGGTRTAVLVGDIVAREGRRWWVIRADHAAGRRARVGGRR